MLQLLLDENISHVVVDGLLVRRPDISMASLHRWRDVDFMNRPDSVLLGAAAGAGLTLVTLDLKTVFPPVSAWGSDGLEHAGVIVVDERTIRSSDFGGLIRALEALWDQECVASWGSRIMFLDIP